MVKTHKKIQSIILKRLWRTISILLLVRIGTFLPVPGINHSDLAFYIQDHSTIKSLVNTFSGNNILVNGLFTLNIFPYINASILIQLILTISPKLAKLQKDGGMEGRRVINQLTRLLTLIWAIIQSLSLTVYLKQILFDWDYILAFEIIIWLTTGAMIVLWLSELITDYGLGNGASLLVYLNIISNLPNLIHLSHFNKTDFGFLIVISISLYSIVFLQEGNRPILLISAKQLTQSKSITKEVKNFLPLKFNQAGVMPIILTTALLVIPNYVSTLDLLPKFHFFESFTFLYWIGYFSLILIFSSFYSEIVLNPKDVADQLQKMAVIIPTVRPGIPTIFYLKQVMQRITVIGSILLAFIVITPNFIESTFNITELKGLSTSSLLILVGVLLDLIREASNIYYSNIYKNKYL